MTCGGGGGFDWSAVVPCIVHHTKVAIIELLDREHRPLSATRMHRLLDDPELTVAQLGYHCKALNKAGVLTVTDTNARAAVNEVFYILAPQE